MEYRTPTPAVLLLADGTIFQGRAVGKIGTTSGELCFNTGMTGYQEIFTDPSYFGQLMVMTAAHIGNYGTKADEIESRSIKISGLICKNFNENYSRPLGDTSLQDYIEWEGLVGIADIDTRALVRHIREKGAMNAIISSETTEIAALKKKLAKVPSMEGLELSSKVSTKDRYTLGSPSARYKVGVLDFGIKKNILRCLELRDCYITVFPWNTPFEELKEAAPDGYFLSNGPGDPAAMPAAIETVKQLLGTGKPIFGICLGHQLLALANDIPTYKMHHGHRGINHPVLNLMTQKSEITSQNHGFGVLAEAVYAKSDTIRVTHKNLNDDTIEGIEMLHYPAFSVQFHPEAAPGPHDSRYLFDNFVTLMENSATERVRVSAKLEIAQKLLAQGFDRKTVAGITELTEMQLAGL